MNLCYHLFVDTCNKYCYVAIYNTTRKIDEIKLITNKNVTDLITISIKKLITKNKVKFEKIVAIYLNIGPGSFTGEKVGVVICKAWSIVFPKIKIYTINSLYLQAITLPAISIIGAKSNKYYLAIYDLKKTIIKPCLVDQKTKNNLVKKYKNFNYYFEDFGNGYNSFLQKKNKFKLTNIDKLEPLYLKNPI